MKKLLLISTAFLTLTVARGQSKNQFLPQEREIIKAITLFNTYNYKIEEWEDAKGYAETSNVDSVTTIFNIPYPVPDNVKVPTEYQVNEMFHKLFNNSETVNYPFDSLKHFINIGYWTDNKFRIIYWDQKQDSTDKMFSQTFIQYKSKIVIKEPLFGVDFKAQFSGVDFHGIPIKSTYKLSDSLYLLVGSQKPDTSNYAEGAWILKISESKSTDFIKTSYDGVQYTGVSLWFEHKGKRAIDYNPKNQIITLTFRSSDYDAFHKRQQIAQSIRNSKKKVVKVKLKFNGKNFTTLN